MQFGNLLFAVLLQFPLGHTASTSYDPTCGYSNTVVSSGFIGHVDTYKLGLLPSLSPEEANQSCSDLFTNRQYRNGSELIGNVADVTAVNFKAFINDKIYGVKLGDERVSATLTGWFYAPLDGLYTFEISVLGAGSITFWDLPCGDHTWQGRMFFACAAQPYPKGAPHIRELQAGVYYPISLVFVQAASSANFSPSVTLPDGSRVNDIGSMVYQIEQEISGGSSKSSTSSGASTTTTTTSASATSSTSASTPASSSSSTSASTPASSSSSTIITTSASSGSSASASTSASISSLSFKYLSSTRVSSSVYSASSSSTPSASPTSIQPSATSSNMPPSATSSNSTLTTTATTTMTSMAESGITTVLTLSLTSTFTYCPECENSTAETVSLPTTTQTETVVVTSTNDEGQTVILTKTITTTYCPESESFDAGHTTLVIPTSSPVSYGIGNTDVVANDATSTICITCTGNGPEDESGAGSGIDFSPVSEPAFTYDSEPAFTSESGIAFTSKSGIDFDTVSGDDFDTVTKDAYTTVSEIGFSTVSGKTYSTASAKSVSSASENGSYNISSTATVSTYDGSGNVMGMMSSLAILPLLALLV